MLLAPSWCEHDPVTWYTSDLSTPLRQRSFLLGWWMGRVASLSCRAHCSSQTLSFIREWTFNLLQSLELELMVLALIVNPMLVFKKIGFFRDMCWDMTKMLTITEPLDIKANKSKDLILGPSLTILYTSCFSSLSSLSGLASWTGVCYKTATKIKREIQNHMGSA